MSAPAEDPLLANAADRRMFLASAAAHGGARVFSKAASAPLERLKVCAQVDAVIGQASSGPGRRSFALFADIVASQGVRSLWRGAGTHIVAASMGGVARLGLLRTSQMWAMPGGDRHYRGLQSYARRCAIFYSTGAAAMVLVYPLDVAYTCLAADGARPRRFRGLFHFTRDVLQHHGVAGLYRGLPLCLATAVPFVAVATAVHDALAPVLLEKSGCGAPRVRGGDAMPGDLQRLVIEAAPTHLYPWNLLLGAFSGLVAQSVTYPLDTLRRRWQLFAAWPSCGAEERPRGLRECALKLYELKGAQGFYAGFGANMAKLVPELLVLCGAYQFINTSGGFV